MLKDPFDFRELDPYELLEFDFNEKQKNVMPFFLKAFAKAPKNKKKITREAMNILLDSTKRLEFDLFLYNIDIDTSKIEKNKIYQEYISNLIKFIKEYLLKNCNLEKEFFLIDIPDQCLKFVNDMEFNDFILKPNKTFFIKTELNKEEMLNELKESIEI